MIIPIVCWPCCLLLYFDVCVVLCLVLFLYLGVGWLVFFYCPCVVLLLVGCSVFVFCVVLGVMCCVVSWWFVVG